jgi:hypothetical protein
MLNRIKAIISEGFRNFYTSTSNFIVITIFLLLISNISIFYTIFKFSASVDSAYRYIDSLSNVQVITSTNNINVKMCTELNNSGAIKYDVNTFISNKLPNTPITVDLIDKNFTKLLKPIVENTNINGVYMPLFVANRLGVWVGDTINGNIINGSMDKIKIKGVYNINEDINNNLGYAILVPFNNFIADACLKNIWPENNSRRSLLYLTTVKNLPDSIAMEQLNTQNGVSFIYQKPLNVIPFLFILIIFTAIVFLEIRKLELSNYLICGFSKKSVLCILLFESVFPLICTILVNFVLTNAITYKLNMVDKIPLFIDSFKLSICVVLGYIVGIVISVIKLKKKNIYKYFKEK